MAFRLPSKDSATWRSIVTALETGSSLFVMAMANDNFRALLLQWDPRLIPVAMFVVALINFVRNYFRSIPNY